MLTNGTNLYLRKSKSDITTASTSNDESEEESTTSPITSLDDVPSGFRQKINDLIRYKLVPLFLIIAAPNLVVSLWYVAVKCDGSFAVFFRQFLQEKQKSAFVVKMWSGSRLNDKFVLSVLSGFAAWGLILMRLLPGSTVNGPITVKGNVPSYKNNGLLYFFVTVLSFMAAVPISRKYGYSPSLVYDKFDSFLATLNAFSFIFCLFLYFKGKHRPSSNDSGATGNWIFDYFWGTELYPRIYGFDIKQFTNCRFGMMAWGLLVMTFALKSYEKHGYVDSMMVSTVLQMLYILKFFSWEAGYLRTIDIILDRAGFYICWGCLVFIPGLYASVSLYLVNHPVRLGRVQSAALLILGILSLIINYLADLQKKRVRETDGRCTVWGRPAQFIRAHYSLENGQSGSNILLTSGWWGLSRHFHYIPEICLALCWTLPAKFQHFMPYCYFCWLVILLVHRSFRDDQKCLDKYGEHWVEYNRRVPYRIIPYVF